MLYTVELQACSIGCGANVDRAAQERDLRTTLGRHLHRGTDHTIVLALRQDDSLRISPRFALEPVEQVHLCELIINRRAIGRVMVR